MNAELQLFNPLDLELSRSTFEYSPTRSGTFNAGRLVPILSHSTMPGDEFTWDVNSLIKMSTPVYPTMDKLFCDVFMFYVPNRLVMSRRYGTPDLNDSIYSWAAFVGSQDNYLNMPIPANGLELPKLSAQYDLQPGSLMDYFDVDPYGISKGLYNVHCLEQLAYFAIWNENFRDPNTMDPVTWQFVSGELVPYGNVPLYATKEEVSVVRESIPATDYVWVNALGATAVSSADATKYSDYWLPFPVCRFHGYFGSMLPWPQRNTEGVELPLGDSAPVYAGFTDNPDPELGPDGQATAPLYWRSTVTWDPIVSDSTSGGFVSISPGGNSSRISPRTGSFPDGSVVAAPSNLFADLRSATAANVNALRAAIQKQRWYEKLARSGNRYDELMYGTFGVRPHDSGDHRPRYLGGRRIELRMDIVASTNGGGDASSGEGSGSLGSLGAFSHTNDEHLKIHAGFDDWGTVMCVICVRHHDTFSTGTRRDLMYRTRDDLYFPTFAHLGEQKTKKSELVSANGLNSATHADPLGYNEAWQENRTMLDTVHGLLRPGQSLDFMTYARSFATAPDLATFLNASTQVEDVDRTLAVSSVTSGFQFVYQMTFNIRARRPLPTHSIPGLMDHF
jgi:hypothetical protein